MLLPILSLLSLLTLSSAKQITLSLSLPAPPQPTTTWQNLNHLATASLARAHHLKHRKTNISITKTPLFPRRYGGYSISLSFGTPPQTLSFIMDTGSSLVWFPCTHNYTCKSCNFANPNKIPTFVPRSSSSSKIVGCKNPKCNWLYPDVKCNEDCAESSSNCTDMCPPYMVRYGLGTTSGLLLSETLTFPEKSFQDFIVGCSLFSTRQPSGIAGFGRGRESLPAQMRLKKFSYCLLSHRYDETTENSQLVLDNGGGDGGTEAGGRRINYTPFGKNPKASNSAFEDYYYVTLRKITVGGVAVDVPEKFLVPDSAGNGGAIVDSGTTFTYMEKAVFDLVAHEFEKQVGKNYKRAADVENQSGLRPCFNVSGENNNLIKLPKFIFHFIGGAKMVLPLGDYFSLVEESVICMTIVANDMSGGGIAVGPAIILGNYQQQNFYMEYDLENERLGFRKQICT